MDQVEIVEPPSGLSVLLLRPVCVGPLQFTKEKHRRVPSPNAELTEFSFVCHVLFLKRFAWSIDCLILLHDIAFVVVVMLVELVGTITPPPVWDQPKGDNLCVYMTDRGGGGGGMWGVGLKIDRVRCSTQTRTNPSPFLEYFAEVCVCLCVL